MLHSRCKDNIFSHIEQTSFTFSFVQVQIILVFALFNANRRYAGHN